MRTTYLFACIKHQIDLKGEPKLTAVDSLAGLEGQEYEIDTSFMECPGYTDSDQCLGDDWVVVTRTGPERPNNVWREQRSKP